MLIYQDFLKYDKRFLVITACMRFSYTFKNLEKLFENQPYRYKRWIEKSKQHVCINMNLILMISKLNQTCLEVLTSCTN